MALRIVPFVVLVCSLVWSYYGVEGRRLSREENEDLEKQLKLLNKPAIKTIRTEYGDIYDCVDFYKQTAFDHPLLKNHTFHYQMRPTSFPKRMKDEDFSIINEPLNMGLKGGGCPVGTVPIRRTSKDDLIRAKLHPEIYASKINPLTAEKPGNHYAIIRTKPDPNKKYNGAGMMISLYNPHTMAFQYSSGQMKIQNGPDSVQVGWTVDPTLYVDNRTRLFTFFKAGESNCFNTQCPGFVIVNSEVPLDFVFEPVSTRGGPIYNTKFFIYRDASSGNWWLEFGTKNIQVGFWPKRIFTGLADLASYVEWGGEVYSLQGEPSPEMGAGQLLTNLDTNFDAFLKRMVVVNEAHEVVDAENTEEYADDSNYYQVSDAGFQGSDFKHLAFFGGPGGLIGD